jgi:hypothetical protein
LSYELCAILALASTSMTTPTRLNPLHMTTFTLTTRTLTTLTTRTLTTRTRLHPSHDQIHFGHTHLNTPHPLISDRPHPRCSYASGRVSWTSSSVPSIDRLRVSFTPITVTAGGKPLQKRTSREAAMLLSLTGVHTDSAGNTDAGGGWWSHNEATGLVVVSHDTDADVVVAAH